MIGTHNTTQLGTNQLARPHSCSYQSSVAEGKILTEVAKHGREASCLITYDGGSFGLKKNN